MSGRRRQRADAAGQRRRRGADAVNPVSAVPAGEAGPAAGAPRVRRRKWPYVLGVLAVVVVAVLFRGDLTLLVSADRPVVTTLERDVVYVQPGAPHVDAAGIRQTFGRRPLAMVVLRPGSALAAHPDKVCDTVVGRIDNLIVAVDVGGEFRYGCESSDVPIVRNAFGWDFAQWELHSSAVQYLPGDVRGQADQLAARYDADVTDGSLRYRPRTFHQPVTRYLLSGGLLLLVVAGVIVLDVGLNRSVRTASQHRAERARRRARRADLDASLSEVAMIMLDLSPPVPASAGTDERRAGRLARLSADYLLALADTERAGPDTELSELEHRVAGLHDRARTLERQ